MPLKAAYLLVAEVNDAAHPQWEVVAYAHDPAPIAHGPYRVDVTTVDGRHLHGDAALVRSVEGAHVLRGAAPLDGITPDDLA